MAAAFIKDDDDDDYDKVNHKKKKIIHPLSVQYQWGQKMDLDTSHKTHINTPRGKSLHSTEPDASTVLACRFTVVHTLNTHQSSQRAE